MSLSFTQSRAFVVFGNGVREPCSNKLPTNYYTQVLPGGWNFGNTSSLFTKGSDGKGKPAPVLIEFKIKNGLKDLQDGKYDNIYILPPCTKV